MADTPVVTRFAPSPTGYLHIGGARTALFNWLYARGRGGRFLLRIEDTDRARSTPEATAAILHGMEWLGLDHDGPIVSQFERAERHAEVANQLLAEGKAYKCFSTQEEIAEFRERAKAEKRSTMFVSPWRDKGPEDHPDLPYVVRIRASGTEKDGQFVADVFEDAVQGRVALHPHLLDDMILLRSDGTPTYMLAVVVDDHDMGVTHVIRGDDHLSNVGRQLTVYGAMGWKPPIFAHIPLIHGPDGKKLSKRHGALGVEEYRAMGYPAAAMRNYLARLGWSHGDDEVFSDEQALAWFDLDGIGKGAARFDFKKLDHISGQHIAAMDDAALIAQLQDYLDAVGGRPLSAPEARAVAKAMPILKPGAKTLPQILDKARFLLVSRPIEKDEKAAAALDDVSRRILTQLTPQLQNASWDRDTLETVLNGFAEAQGTKFGKLAAPLRAALAGRAVTPSVFDMMLLLGRDESIARLEEAAV